jgi:PAS domain S-box-containing protein
MNPERGRVPKWLFAVGGCLLVGLVLALWYLRLPVAFTDRVYRIGWRPFAPFVYAVEGSAPTGLSAELVREAARRRGIRLEWITTDGTMLEGVERHHIDLFPIAGIDSVRAKTMHFTDPYLQTEICLIVRAGSAFQRESDLAGSLVSVANRTSLLTRFERLLPRSRALLRPQAAEALHDVCTAASAAAFLEEWEANVALAAGACGGVPVQIRSVAGSKTDMGLASTFEAAAAADAIRDEIGKMASEGRLPGIVSRWVYYSSSKMEALDELLTARRRVRSLLGFVALLVVAAIGAVWQAVRIKREQSRAERAERALTTAERNLRLVANSLRDMVIAYDMNRGLVYANPAVADLTGYSEEELRRHAQPCWIHDEDRERILVQWERVFSGESFTDEYRLVSKTGETRWLAASWGPMRNESGRQIGVQGLERDVSDQKRAEVEQARLEDQLRQSQKLESIGILAGGVAHDFNNLLTVINGYSELILADTDAADPRYPALTEIRRSGHQAGELTQQLLAFSRRQVIQPKYIDLNEIISTSMSMFKRLIGEDIDLAFNLAPSLATIYADAGQMTQVLMNLVVNARDAMRHGGRLLIGTANVTLDDAFVAHHAQVQPGSYVQLIVTDTGIGMDEETRQHIFEPFFTTKPVGEGTGLGLSTVYGIVRQNKGWIWVYSEPGKGSTFKIHLPACASGDAVQDARLEERMVAARAGERLLVVEDQPEVRSYAVDVLTQSGYLVESAATADEALELARDPGTSFDLLVSDVVLPGMNGKQLAERLLAARPGLKVLFMSGYPGDLIGRRGMELEDVALLQKPFTPAALTAKVREVLDGS